MSETTKIEYRARVWEEIDTFDAVAAVDNGGEHARPSNRGTDSLTVHGRSAGSPRHRE
ncbi:hypothetical protein [Rhodococcus erythropolis]|uniref:Uncharacterized protein n=1 Tax=Rhodococcus erythropolis TaxID=1833 RepID=A0A8I0ZQ08_RHOER|nr:hypothetical protein [Rhodococcus erythropolis]MBH5143500.1 hypothetical protein [Rhodococcus erythropolis]